MSQSAKEAKTPASDDAMGVGFPSSSSRSGRFASESIGYSSSNRERSISTSSPERISSKSKPSTPSKPPPREHSVENTTIGDAQSGKDFFVSSIDASLFLWNLLWSPNKSTHNEVDLLDTIILQNGVMTSWLFTTKEGEVKSKAKKRWNVNSVVDRLHGPGNGTFGFAFAGGYWSYVTSPDSATNIIQSSSGKAALLSYAHLVPPNFTPSPETPPHSSFLRVDYDYIFNLDQSKAKGNDSGEARMRFWSLCNAQAMGKAQSPTAQVMQKLPADLLVCRNQTLCGLGARALKQFLKIIETDTGRRVTRLSLVFFVQDLVKSASSDDSSRLWLAFAQEVRLVQKNSSKVNVDLLLSAAGDKSISSMASSLSLATSLANIFLKPSYACAGDFCRYLQDQSEGSTAGFSMESASILAEDEGFDVKMEAYRAIQRHRRTDETDPSQRLATRASLHSESPRTGSATGSSRAELEKTKPSYDLLPAASAAASLSGEDRTFGMSTKATAETIRSVLPAKERFVLNKSIACAREEMEAVELIESQFGGVENEAKLLDMKERLAALWPMQIVRWWLGVGRNQHKNPRFGKVASVTSKAPPEANISNTAQIVRLSESTHRRNTKLTAKLGADQIVHDEERQGYKWFSFHHTPERVCESCYRVYSELDKHRDRRLLAMKSKPKPMDKAEERELERRIFAQRKACSKLARPVPRVLESAEVADASRSSKSNRGVPRDLPPLASGSSKARSRSTGSLLSGQPRLVEHIMKRAPAPVPSHAANPDFAEVAEQWRTATDRSRWEALNEYKPFRLVPVEVEKPKVNVDAYTAENLLHPWQREFQKMKKMVYGGETTTESSAVPPSNAAPSTSSDPFASMVGLGSRMSSASEGSLMLSANFSRPTTNHSSRGDYMSPNTGGGTLSAKRSWTAENSIAEEQQFVGSRGDAMADDDEEDDPILGSGQLGWNPFVLQS